MKNVKKVSLNSIKIYKNSVLSNTLTWMLLFNAKKRKKVFLLVRSKISHMLPRWTKSRKLRKILILLVKNVREEEGRCKLMALLHSKSLMPKNLKHLWLKNCCRLLNLLTKLRTQIKEWKLARWLRQKTVKLKLRTLKSTVKHKMRSLRKLELKKTKRFKSSVKKMIKFAVQSPKNVALNTMLRRELLTLRLPLAWSICSLIWQMRLLMKSSRIKNIRFKDLLGASSLKFSRMETKLAWETWSPSPKL